MMQTHFNLFSDEQMRDFIVNGYVTVKTDLPRSVHETIYRKTQEYTEKEGNLGNNIFPRVPELQAVFDDPVVRGAFTSILGQNYVMHSHRHPHRNAAHSGGQGFHKDSYWGHQKVRHHLPRWAMAFYYPQDTPVEIGPSAILSGTQYYSNRITENNDGETALNGEAGTVSIIHFDLWHRAMANHTDKTRYMMKFQFIRLDEPREPEWNVENTKWETDGLDVNGNLAAKRHETTWRHVWKWMTGNSNGYAGQQANGNLAKHIEALSDEDPTVRSDAADELGLLGESAADAIPMLSETLRNNYEPARLNAAYTLGAIGEPAVSALIEKLADENGPTRRMAAYGLAAVGEPAVPALCEALEHENDGVRVEATYALAQIGSTAESAVSALIERSEDSNVEVRRYIPEAFGAIGASAAPAVPTLIDRLANDDDVQVRFESALALAQIGPASSDAIPVLKDSLSDKNRYVRDNSIHALKRISTPEAESVLFDYLLMARWCPITNSESTF
ncbi:MAG: HEAT repeat domain-containing protein [Candidatus Poribacteria bacterium]|nr:HEAT repeat domain-containing protein [Candidatus Poribacteria bacterium]